MGEIIPYPVWIIPFPVLKNNFEPLAFNPIEKRKWNYPNRKWNYLTHFQASDQKTSFTKCFSFDLKSSKLIFKTGNGIIQTGNGIISPSSRPLIKKTVLKYVSHLTQRVQNLFSKEEMELFLTPPGL